MAVRITDRASQFPLMALITSLGSPTAWSAKACFTRAPQDGGRTFSEPMPIGRPDRNPSHPYLIAAKGTLWLAWKEFDGEKTTVPVMISHDNGRTWSTPNVAAETSNASDHPLLVTDGTRVFLSWQAQSDGYRFMPLEDAP